MNCWRSGVCAKELIAQQRKEEGKVRFHRVHKIPEPALQRAKLSFDDSGFCISNFDPFGAGALSLSGKCGVRLDHASGEGPSLGQATARVARRDHFVTRRAAFWGFLIDQGDS